MKTLIIIFFLIIAVKAYADESPYKIGIMELIVKTISTNDDVYMTRAALRCGALNNLLFHLFTRDSPNSDFSYYKTSSSKFLGVAEALSKRISEKRGLNSEQLNAAQDRLIQELEQYMNIYGKWLNDNFTEQGEYFGSSPSFQNEIRECKQFSEELDQ